MLPEELLSRLEDQPFVPFRMHLADGRRFDVANPALLWVGRRMAFVAVPEPGPEPYIATQHTIALLDIVRMEPLPDTPANGDANR